MSDPKPTTKKATKKARATATKTAAAKPPQNVASLSIDQLTQLIASEVSKAVGSLAGGRAGVHVNSGPPGFVNGGGHANFDPKTTLAGADLARSHVNSGPPGFVNGGGHANFDPRTTLAGADLSRVHVNSGPPGFVNGGGHANFDPRLAGRFTLVSLPDGTQANIPASGPVDIMVRGFRIKR